MSRTISEHPPRSDRAGWLGAGAIAAVLGASWWWILFLPLGDSHDGRINGRFGLHVRNFLDLGPVESSFGSALAPLAEGTYAHHPPALNAIQVTVGWLLGRGEWQLHLVGWLAGMATVLLVVGVMRELGIGWAAALAAVALTAATPMFWIYARLGLGMAPALALVLVVLRNRDGEATHASWPLRAAVFLGVASSWPNALLAAVLTLWMVRRSRRVAVEMAVAGGLAALAVAVWILQATDVSELTSHVETRLQAPVGWAGFVDQYRFFYTSLFPRWYLWLMVPALVAGLARRSTRPVVIALLGVGAAWTVALPEAAFVHDYWTYPLLGPVMIGLGSLIHWAAGDEPWRQILVPAALVLLGAVTFVSLQRGPYPDDYFAGPAEAGRLLRSTGPTEGQALGYVAGPIALPRWMSYYWGLDVAELSAESIEAVDEGHLVLVRLDLPPDWAPDLAGAGIVARSGRYVLVEAGELVP